MTAFALDEVPHFLQLQEEACAKDMIREESALEDSHRLAVRRVKADISNCEARVDSVHQGDHHDAVKGDGVDYHSHLDQGQLSLAEFGVLHLDVASVTLTAEVAADHKANLWLTVYYSMMEKKILNHFLGVLNSFQEHRSAAAAAILASQKRYL